MMATVGILKKNRFVDVPASHGNKYLILDQLANF
jgi:hypothetical protein